MVRHWINDKFESLRNKIDAYPWSIDYNENSETGPVHIKRNDYTDNEIRYMFGSEMDLDDLDRPEVSIYRSPMDNETIVIEYVSDSSFTHPFGRTGDTRAGQNLSLEKFHPSNFKGEKQPHLDAAIDRAINLVEKHEDKN